MPRGSERRDQGRERVALAIELAGPRRHRVAVVMPGRTIGLVAVVQAQQHAPPRPRMGGEIQRGLDGGVE
jgi:hypothetical protein